MLYTEWPNKAVYILTNSVRLAAQSEPMGRPLGILVCGHLSCGL